MTLIISFYLWKLVDPQLLVATLENENYTDIPKTIRNIPSALLSPPPVNIGTPHSHNPINMTNIPQSDHKIETQISSLKYYVKCEISKQENGLSI